MASFRIPDRRKHDRIPNVTLKGSGTGGLVVLHGFTQTRLSMVRPLVELARTYDHTTFVECPGHGSWAEPYPTIEEFLNQLRDLIDGEDLLGYSMGGRLALWLFATHPESIAHCAVLSANPGIEDPTQRAQRVHADEAIARTLDAIDHEDQGLGTDRSALRDFLRTWNTAAIFHGRELSAAQEEARLGSRPRGLAFALRSYGTGVQPNLTPILSRTSGSLSYLVGERDDAYVIHRDRLVDARPATATATIAGAGHDLLAERPNETIATLIDLLERG
ncbi:MAG: alpha/beta fold hydrolase [Ferrimicrobium sp.]